MFAGKRIQEELDSAEWERFEKEAEQEALEVQQSFAVTGLGSCVALWPCLKAPAALTALLGRSR